MNAREVAASLARSVSLGAKPMDGKLSRVPQLAATR